MSEVHFCKDCEHRVGSDPYYMACKAHKTERFQSTVSGIWYGGEYRACYDVRTGDTCKRYEKRKTLFERLVVLLRKSKED